MLRSILITSLAWVFPFLLVGQDTNVYPVPPQPRTLSKPAKLPSSQKNLGGRVLIDEIPYEVFQDGTVPGFYTIDELKPNSFYEIEVTVTSGDADIYIYGYLGTNYRLIRESAQDGMVTESSFFSRSDLQAGEEGIYILVYGYLTSTGIIRVYEVTPCAADMLFKFDQLPTENNTQSCNRHFPEGHDLLITADVENQNDIQYIELFIDGDLLRRETNPPYLWGNVSADNILRDMEPGTYELVMKLLDTCGDTQERRCTVVIDRVCMVDAWFQFNGQNNPQNQPPCGAHFPEGQSIVVDAGVIDEGDIEYINLSINNDLIRQDRTSPFNWGNPGTTNAAKLMNLSPGTYQLQMSIRDKCGGTIIRDCSFIIDGSCQADASFEYEINGEMPDPQECSYQIAQSEPINVLFGLNKILEIKEVAVIFQNQTYSSDTPPFEIGEISTDLPLGTYPIQLTVTDTCDQQVIKTCSIVIEERVVDPPCQANFDFWFEYEGQRIPDDEPCQMTYPKGANFPIIVGVENADHIERIIVVFEGQEYTSEASPYHFSISNQVSVSGTFPILLVAIDQCGNSHEKECTIILEDMGCSASFTLQINGQAQPDSDCMLTVQQYDPVVLSIANVMVPNGTPQAVDFGYKVGGRINDSALEYSVNATYSLTTLSPGSYEVYAGLRDPCMTTRTCTVVIEESVCDPEFDFKGDTNYIGCSFTDPDGIYIEAKDEENIVSMSLSIEGSTQTLVDSVAPFGWSKAEIQTLTSRPAYTGIPVLVTLTNTCGQNHSKSCKWYGIRPPVNPSSNPSGPTSTVIIGVRGVINQIVDVGGYFGPSPFPGPPTKPFTGPFITDPDPPGGPYSPGSSFVTTSNARLRCRFETPQNIRVRDLRVTSPSCPIGFALTADGKNCYQLAGDEPGSECTDGYGFVAGKCIRQFTATRVPGPPTCPAGSIVSSGGVCRIPVPNAPFIGSMDSITVDRVNQYEVDFGNAFADLDAHVDEGGQVSDTETDPEVFDPDVDLEENEGGDTGSEVESEPPFEPVPESEPSPPLEIEFYATLFYEDIDVGDPSSFAKSLNGSSGYDTLNMVIPVSVYPLSCNQNYWFACNGEATDPDNCAMIYPAGHDLSIIVGGNDMDDVSQVILYYKNQTYTDDMAPFEWIDLEKNMKSCSVPIEMTVVTTCGDSIYRQCLLLIEALNCQADAWFDYKGTLVASTNCEMMYMEGHDLTLRVGSDHPENIAEVVFSFGLQTYTDKTLPFEWEGVAENMLPGSYPVSMSVTDLCGTTFERTCQIVISACQMTFVEGHDLSVRAGGDNERDIQKATLFFDNEMLIDDDYPFEWEDVALDMAPGNYPISMNLIDDCGDTIVRTCLVIVEPKICDVSLWLSYEGSPAPETNCEMHYPEGHSLSILTTTEHPEDIQEVTLIFNGKAYFKNSVPFEWPDIAEDMALGTYPLSMVITDVCGSVFVRACQVIIEPKICGDDFWFVFNGVDSSDMSSAVVQPQSIQQQTSAESIKAPASLLKNGSDIRREIKDQQSDNDAAAVKTDSPLGEKVKNLIQGVVSKTISKETKGGVEKGLVLVQNQPNPFDHETIVSFYSPLDSQVRLAIFDVSGKEVMQHESFYKMGWHQLIIENERLPGAGLYIYELSNGQETVRKKMMSMK